MIFTASIAEIDEYIIERRSENTPIQPIIFIYVTPNKSKEIIIVLFICVQFKQFFLLVIIDVWFKMNHIFNLDYPLQSSFIWLFIQKYFYLLNTKHNKDYHALGQMLPDLNNK